MPKKKRLSLPAFAIPVFGAISLVVAIGVPAAATTAAAESKLTFSSSSDRLNAAFAWAKKQAMAYVFAGDPVGPWYEAALPKREAFCMRDVSHQAAGARALGLAAWNKNMFLRFAENISASKDWCTYWEINRHNKPAPVDYRNDREFWYNLPANFDVLDALWREYLWTGDKAYLEDPVFLNFAERTVKEYVERWDLAPEKILVRPEIMNLAVPLDRKDPYRASRGLPSYNEEEPGLNVGADLPASQYAAYRAYAGIRSRRGDLDEAKTFWAKTAEMKIGFHRTWWDEAAGAYNVFHYPDGRFTKGIGQEFLLYFGVAAAGRPARQAVDEMLNPKKERGIEMRSYYPEIFFRYGEDAAAVRTILELCDPATMRREYPEVSYAVVGAMARGLIGIEPDAISGTVATRSRLTPEIRWAEMAEVPVLATTIKVRHEGTTRTSFTNSGPTTAKWKACFAGRHVTIDVSGERQKAQFAYGEDGRGYSFVLVPVTQGETAEASVVLVDFASGHLAVGLAPDALEFRYFSVDSLSGGNLGWNPVLPEGPTISATRFRLEKKDRGEFIYLAEDAAGRTARAWTVVCREKTLALRSDYTKGANVPPFLLAFDQKSNHATVLGLMNPGERRVPLPCVLHLPDMGSVRIAGNPSGLALDYDARRYVKTPFVRVAFPPATAANPHVEYRLEVAAIHPAVPGLEKDPRFDGFRRSFLNLFQVNPRVQMLANNASSDPVPFTLYMDAEMAVPAPPLADGLTCLGLVRMTLDRYLAGAKGYGLIGYGIDPGEADLVAWKAPWNSLDTFPSLLIAAGLYVQGSGDTSWAGANYEKLAAWAGEMAAFDKDGDGLLEHPHSGNSGDRATADRRPSNWWDTINFGHKDAYANALAYRAYSLWSEVAWRLGKDGDAKNSADRAAKLRAAYKKTFWNPETGVLAGWRSADGRLHDYYFTFVNGIAVAYGLLDAPDANAVMDRLLAKMKQVGFTDFRLGLPGNLIPVRKADYVFHNWDGARAIGEPSLDDGSDAFQIYENGGSTACYAYFTIKALYSLGRREDARAIFYPMLESYARGDFQGFCDNGKSKDWRDWNGGCHGYEGLLTDGFLALLAVLDDVKAAR
jgi:hypothetical protein